MARGRGTRRRGTQGAKQDTHSETGNTVRGDCQGAVRATSKGTTVLTPKLEDVVASIHSLYNDELKPFGRILRKRVVEIIRGSDVEDASAMYEVDASQLRNMCESCEMIHVEPEEGGDWSALIEGRTQNFIDIYSSVNVYPMEMWNQAAFYFANVAPEAMVLPGGRYACAQTLQARNLPFLAGRSLGQVSHIVQLAISQQKLLGYSNGSIVPYGRSQSMLKERCAVIQQPCLSTARSQHNLPLATWDVARTCLREILANTGSEPGTIPLSNVKRIFRSRYQLELSETTLGHSKISELLQDVRFRDICKVQLVGHGYIVTQQTDPVEIRTLCLADSIMASSEAAPMNELLAVDTKLDFPSDSRVPATDEAPAFKFDALALSPSTLGKEGSVGRMVQNTFIHTAPPPITPVPGASRRSHSQPKDMGSVRSAWEDTYHALSFMPKPVESSSDATGETEEGVSDCNVGPSPSLSSGSGVCSRESSVSKTNGFPIMPFDLGYEDSPFIWQSPSTRRKDSLCTPCPDDEVCVNGNAATFFDWAAAVPEKEVTPPTFHQDHNLVRNTFIHASLPPPSPLPGAVIRSRSVPKDVFSRRREVDVAPPVLELPMESLEIAHETSSNAFDIDLESSCDAFDLSLDLKDELEEVPQTPAVLKLQQSPLLTSSPQYITGLASKFSFAPSTNVLHLADYIGVS